MSFLMPCPNCGPRDIAEFTYGGQLGSGPHNLPQPQEERWYHRLGCRRWLVAIRDVRNNAVAQTRWLDEDSR